MKSKYKIPDDIRKFLSSTVNRRKMLEKCGRDAFLDPDKLRYPVKNPKTCKYDINLIHAAYVRSHEMKDQKMIAKANKLWDLAQKGKLESHRYPVTMEFMESVDYDYYGYEDSLGKILFESSIKTIY